jgi:putative methylase
MKKKEIVSIIQNTATFTNPKIELEQYCIDASSAVDLLYFAGFEFDDIKNRLIFDFGAGTGRLSIISAYFKATYVLSVDIDWSALKILNENILSLDLKHIIFPICSDIDKFEISNSILPRNLKITTIMNPPFGVQKKAADRVFLEKAFNISDVVYSVHLANVKVSKFISNYIKKFNWKIDYVYPFNMILERTFPFHSKKRKNINVKIYRFIKI